MKVDDFIARFRAAVADEVHGQFWSDAEIVSYLNEAVQEACERAKLIEDRSMPLALVPGQDTYDLHPSVFEIKRLTFRGRPLDETSVEELDCDAPGWELRSGEPRCFIFEQASGSCPMPASSPQRLNSSGEPGESQLPSASVTGCAPSGEPIAPAATSM